ncbi:MAG: hypothetical protein WA892_08420 [Ornithinimicrobium sp.]
MRPSCCGPTRWCSTDRTAPRAPAATALIRSRAVILAGLHTLLAATVVTTTAVAATALAAGTVSPPMGALVTLTPIALTEALVGLAEVSGA